MLSNPCLDTTVVSEDNLEWRPSNVENFLVEFNHIIHEIGEVCFFRGQRRIDRLLDSTFARSLKAMLQMPINSRYPDQALSSVELQHHLANLWLNKIDAIQLHPDLLKIESLGVDLYFEYHRHHQQNPDDEYINDIEPKGTNFIDFSYDWKVGLFFANLKRDVKDEGVLYIVQQTRLGPVLQTEPFSNTIAALRKTLSENPQNLYSYLPLMIYPKGQLNNFLDPKPKRQNAVYMAQMDFRLDLEESWQIHQSNTGKQVYLKLILPAGTCNEINAFLDAHGITKEFLFPPTKFDKKLASI